MGTLVRRAAIVLALGAVVFGALQYANGSDPLATADKDLRQRLDKYMELRLAGDWSALYQMTDPKHRRLVDEASYLQAFGHGMAELTKVKALTLELYPSTRTATTVLFTELRLVVENMPAKIKDSLRMPDDPSALGQSGNHSLDWVWRDGEWYFLMDDFLVTERSDGRKVAPITSK